jgi:hypothetical protein
VFLIWLYLSCGQPQTVGKLNLNSKQWTAR